MLAICHQGPAKCRVVTGRWTVVPERTGTAAHRPGHATAGAAWRGGRTARGQDGEGSLARGQDGEGSLARGQDGEGGLA
jgi:hypothetical protein